MSRVNLAETVRVSSPGGSQSSDDLEDSKPKKDSALRKVGEGRMRRPSIVLPTLLCWLALAVSSSASDSSGAAAATSQAPEVAPSHEAAESAPAWLYFDLEQLVAHRAESERPWHGFLDSGSMRAGLYELAAGASDLQRPHTEDEIYYVISGRAVLEVDGERQSVAPGSIVFVRAEVEHRFVDIEEPLRVLVVFAAKSSSDD